MFVLVLQPVRPSNPPALRDRASALLGALPAANPGMVFDIRQDDAAIPIPPHPSLYMRHATVRNYMLDTYLKEEHTHVLWVDSDLIDYPADLPGKLMQAASQCPQCPFSYADTCQDEDYARCLKCETCWPGTIAAPLALLSESSGFPSRFYDIGGFIEKGTRARMFPPWFEGEGEVIELDSVGCCYLVPAQLYKQGIRYAPPPTDYYVEHWSVMQEAKKRGYRIVALTGVHAVHAWLPDYGLEVN
jgi:hypothetical protein